MGFFDELGLKFKIERGNRVFPESDHSSDVIGALSRQMKKLGVNVLLNTQVVAVNEENGEFAGVVVKDASGQKELSEIFLLQTKAMPGILISVSAVRISPDRSIARVYLSVFPSEKAEEMVKNINENMKSIRFELGTRVRHQLRILPELMFFVDDSLDYIEKIVSLLK